MVVMKILLRQAVTLCFVWLFYNSSAQCNKQYDQLNVSTTNTDNLLSEYQFQNGIDASFISAVDINNDQIDDLVIQSMLSGYFSSFIYNQQEEKYIPFNSFHSSIEKNNFWEKFDDFNCDGIADKIKFEDHNNLIINYGFYENNILKFGQDALITFSASADIFDPLDPPVFRDYDADGDLDLFVINSLGKNISLFENTGDCQLPSFSESNSCWKNLEFNLYNNEINLEGECVQFTVNEQQRQLHLIPTFQFVDWNNDNELDLLLGNPLNGIIHIIIFENEYPVSQNQILEQYNFSTLSRPNFLLSDINKNGTEELIIYKSFFSDEESIPAFHFEKNESNEFVYLENESLTNLSYDFGKNINLKIKDLNADGVQDILCINEGLGQESGFSKFYALINTGTENNPSFQFIDTFFNFLNLPSSYNLKPEFADFDLDGNEDLILGRANQSPAILSAWNTNTSNNWQTILEEVSLINSKPVAIDINNDGKKDLLIAERNGNVNYFRNISQQNQIAFELISENFGNIDTRIDGLPYGQASLAFGRFGADGNLLVVLNETSLVEFYSINEDETIDFHCSYDFSSFYPSFSDLDVKDINGDTNPEWLFGCREGGLIILNENFDVINDIKSTIQNQMLVYPNPASDYLYLNSNLPFSSLTIQSINGKVLIQDQTYLSHINISGLKPGIYFISIDFPHKTIKEMFIKL